MQHSRTITLLVITIALSLCVSFVANAQPQPVSVAPAVPVNQPTAEPQPAPQPEPAPAPAPAVEPTPQPSVEPMPEPTRVPGEKPRVIVQDLRANGVPTDVAASLTDLLVVEMVRQDRYEVIGKQDILAILKNEEQKQLLGCDEDQCITDFGKLFDAPYLMKGSVGVLGETYVVNIDLVNTRSLKVERRVSQTLAGGADELIGVMRAAVLALELGERGAGKQITEDLLEEMLISQSMKTMFFHLRMGYEIPVGPVSNKATIKYILPSYTNILFDLGVNVTQWCNIGLSTGFAFSMAEKYSNQYKNATEIYDETLPIDDPMNTPVGYRLSVSSSEFDYSAYRIPFDLFVRFQPSSGTFLPYAFLGPGISYNMVQFENNRIGRYEEYMIDDRFPDLAGTALAQQTDCALGEKCYESYFSLKPQNDNINYMALDFVTGAGLDIILAKNVGLTFEVRYLLSYSFKSEGDLEQTFDMNDNRVESNPTRYLQVDGQNLIIDEAGNTDRSVKSNYIDIAPLRQTHHGIMANIGVMFYF